MDRMSRHGISKELKAKIKAEKLKDKEIKEYIVERYWRLKKNK